MKVAKTKFKNSETAIPFEDLLIEAYDNKDNKDHLDSMLRYVSKYRRDYSLVCLYTLRNTIRFYILELEEKV